LVLRTHAIEDEIAQLKARHEETLQKFKSTAQVWKDGIQKLSLSQPGQDMGRVDSVASTAKDAVSAISAEMTSPAIDVEQINQQVLSTTGDPSIQIRAAAKVRPVGKHIAYEPARRDITSQPGQRSPPHRTMLPMEDSSMQEDSEDGHANEAFETMEAMEFDVSTDYGYDSENITRS
jgi:hypothetical protein